MQTRRAPTLMDWRSSVIGYRLLLDYEQLSEIILIDVTVIDRMPRAPPAVWPPPVADPPAVEPPVVSPPRRPPPSPSTLVSMYVPAVSPARRHPVIVRGPPPR